MSLLVLLFSLSSLLSLPLMAADDLPDTWEKEIKELSAENQEQARRMAEDLQESLNTKKGRLYMNFEQGMYQDVLSKPGFSSAGDCSRTSAGKVGGKSAPACQKVGSVGAETEVSATGTVRFQEKQNADLDRLLTVSYEVTYKDKDGKSQKGWVPADLVRTTPTEEMKESSAWFSGISDWIGKKCDAVREKFGDSKPLQGNNIRDMDDVHSAAKKWAEDERRTKDPLSQVAAKISPLIGQCVVPMKENEKRDQKTKSFTPQMDRDDFEGPKNQKAQHPVVYDQKVLPELMKNFSTARDLNIPHLNARSLIEIDSLARTIYAEMQGCVPIGAEYPMAVARVMKNRESMMANKPGKKKEFIYQQEPQWPGKSLSTQAASSPVQFTSWNLDMIDFDELREARGDRAADLIRSGKSRKEANIQARKEIAPDPNTKEYYKFNKSGLLHTLCPPSDPNKPDWSGQVPPDPNQLAIWKTVVKIATDAVLYPKEFDKKTSQLEGIAHYTSDRSSFYDMKQVCPSIEGKKLTNNRCLNLWVPPNSNLLSDPALVCGTPKKDKSATKTQRGSVSKKRK